MHFYGPKGNGEKVERIIKREIKSGNNTTSDLAEQMFIKSFKSPIQDGST